MRQYHQNYLGVAENSPWLFRLVSQPVAIQAICCMLVVMIFIDKLFNAQYISVCGYWQSLQNYSSQANMSIWISSVYVCVCVCVYRRSWPSLATRVIKTLPMPRPLWLGKSWSSRRCGKLRLVCYKYYQHIIVSIRLRLLKNEQLQTGSKGLHACTSSSGAICIWPLKLIVGVNPLRCLSKYRNTVFVAFYLTHWYWKSTMDRFKQIVTSD